MNTGILLLGTVIASWMGTTGAAMLLIRPILNANERPANTRSMWSSSSSSWWPMSAGP
ncbi:MAG: sodium:proton antiporter [Thalassobaculum sp.]